MKQKLLRHLSRAGRLAAFAAALYCFLVSIELLSRGFEGLGAGFAQGLFALTANPVSGLFVGILATAVFQSSSSTTAIVIGLVARGTLGVGQAVPVVIGANIGTTVTNSLVSLAHAGRRDEFERAFAASNVLDFFNMLTAAVLWPLEVALQPLARASGLLTRLVQGHGGVTFTSPLKLATSPARDAVTTLFGGLAPLVLAVALALLLLSMRVMLGSMKKLVGSNVENVVNRHLFARSGRAMLVGLGFTALLQSSSATTALAVPLVGAGLLTLERFYPYALGANVGTTVTAWLAALVTGSPAAVQIAVVHMLFNITGVAIWLPLRRLPLALARRWSGYCARHRGLALAYVVAAFFVLPLVVVMLLRG
ncbi:MAG: Na/Pi symporter [candidate division WOR-3 bacterium]